MVALLFLTVALIMGVCVCFRFFCALPCVLSSFAIISLQGERANCFSLFVFLVFLVFCGCYCSVALPHGPVGCSAACDCGIS